MLNRSFCVAAIVLAVAAGGAPAQSLRDTDGPAEYPPASYRGNQYVDSNGCVFIRAGVGGQVTWVPRVGRDRQLVCGFRPTFAEAPQGAAPTATEQVVIIEAAEPETVSPGAKVKPVARPAATPAPRAKARTPVVTAARPKPAKRTVVRAAPSATATRATATAQPAPGTVLRRGEIPPGTRVVPRHVYEKRLAAADVPVAPPAGYAPAFRDDRLNPRRAEMTAAGIASSEKVWTDTVPRRLVRRSAAGRGGYVSSRGTTKAATTAGKPATAHVSTRSAPQATPARHRFVQVGMFGVRGNASRAAARLEAAGLPARLVKARQNGKVLHVVISGPFADEGSTGRALRIARRAGFGDAFTRK
ncbi:MAG: SPOR domain-containing protein [Pseudooceanicola sp.]